MPRPDLVFYDLFSGRTHAEAWTLSSFRRLFEAFGARDVELFTYTASTAARVAMLGAGFLVATGRATDDKPESTIAFTPPRSITGRPAATTCWGPTGSFDGSAPGPATRATCPKRTGARSRRRSGGTSSFEAFGSGSSGRRRTSWRCAARSVRSTARRSSTRPSGAEPPGKSHDGRRPFGYLSSVERERRPGSVQFSIASPFTRPNSAVLFVTSTRPRLRACAAMNRSLAPMRAPRFFRSARISA